MRIPDLCYLVFDYCDNETLRKLSMTCHLHKKQLLQGG